MLYTFSKQNKNAKRAKKLKANLARGCFVT